MENSQKFFTPGFGNALGEAASQGAQQAATEAAQTVLLVGIVGVGLLALTIVLTRSVIKGQRRGKK